MPPPSALAIATSSVQRLVKEEASYHKELEKQRARLAASEASDDKEDENKEFRVKQEKAAIEETNAVFVPLRQRIQAAVEKLQDQLEAGKEKGSASAEEVEKAMAAIESAKGAVGGK